MARVRALVVLLAASTQALQVPALSFAATRAGAATMVAPAGRRDALATAAALAAAFAPQRAKALSVEEIAARSNQIAAEEKSISRAEKDAKEEKQQIALLVPIVALIIISPTLGIQGARKAISQMSSDEAKLELAAKDPSIFKKK